MPRKPSKDFQVEAIEPEPETPLPSTKEEARFSLFRGTGHRDDSFDPRDYPVEGKLDEKAGTWKVRPVGGLKPPGSDIPASFKLPVAKARDQGGTSMCVGFGFAVHVNARLAWLTQTDPDSTVFPSPKGIYGVAKRNEPMDNSGNFLEDAGCFPREAAKGMMIHGLVSEARLPFVESAANEALPMDVLSAGFDARVLRFHRMTFQGLAVPFIDEMERLIASGYTIPYAQRVDEAFNNYTSGVLGVPKGSIQGSHYTNLYGFDRSRRVAYGVNSWGRTSWGRDGHYEISYDRLLTPGFCSDFIVLITLPEIRSIR